MPEVDQFPITLATGSAGTDFGISTASNNTGDFSYIGAPSWSNGSSGKVHIYYSNSYAMAYLSDVSRKLPDGTPFAASGDGFGACVDTDLSGDILVVSSHSNVHAWSSSSSDTSNIYIYKRTVLDWTAYTSNVIVHPSGSSVKGFGLSISIASENPGLLCVGSPYENKVYVYDIIASPTLLYTDVPIWSGTDSNGNDWSAARNNGNNSSRPNGGSVFENYANVVSQNASTISPVRLDPTYDQYGFSVSMTPDGWAFAASAPGTQSNVYVGKGLSYSVNSDITDDIKDSEGNWNYQSGYVKVVYAPADWNTVSDAYSVPYALGDQDLLNGDINRYELSKFSAFGYSIAISGFLTSEPFLDSSGNEADITMPTIRLAVGVPGESGVRAFRYSYIHNRFVPIGDLILGDPGSGTKISMTYNGNRIASGSDYNFTKEETGPHQTSKVYQIYDFNGSFWSHYDPYDSISSNIGFTTSMSYDGLFIINSGRTNDKGHVHGGKDQFGYEAVEFLKLGRTIKVVGNTTIGGDISARDFVVGGGKYTTYPNYSGQVIFSDTPGADTGSNALIRNWNYKNDNVTSSTFNNQNNYTSSELLIHKGGEYPDKLKAWGREPDRIRVQGRSIVLDTTYSDDVNPSNTHPKFVLDTFGKIGVNLPELQPESLTLRGGFGPYKENIKARLDVNGRTAIRNKLDIDYGNKSNVTIGKQTLVHYDTRDINCLKGIYLQDSGPREVYRSNLTSVSCNYKSSERGIYINESGNIKGVINTDIGNNTAVSFWFMMENEHSTYNNKTLFYIGNTNTNVQEQIIACEIYYTSSTDHGIRLHFINENSRKLEFKYTLVSKKWHHIYFEREGTLQINNL